MKFEVRKTSSLGLRDEYEVKLAYETKEKIKKIFSIAIYAGSAITLFSIFRSNKETDTKNLNEVTTEES